MTHRQKESDTSYIVSNCPYLGDNARKAIKSMPEYFKGQEGANMELVEGKEKELLYQYEKTGLTPEQISALLEHLKGECWLCRHSKPYDISPSRKLSVCELGYPHREGTQHSTKPIAQIRDKRCNYWRLKEFATESKGGET